MTRQRKQTISGGGGLGLPGLDNVLLCVRHLAGGVRRNEARNQSLLLFIFSHALLLKVRRCVYEITLVGVRIT